MAGVRFWRMSSRSNPCVEPQQGTVSGFVQVFFFYEKVLRVAVLRDLILVNISQPINLIYFLISSPILVSFYHFYGNFTLI